MSKAAEDAAKAYAAKIAIAAFFGLLVAGPAGAAVAAKAAATGGCGC